jgi:hypothetical protein
MQDTSINYVVALYFGKRNMPGVNNMLLKDPYSIAKAHLHALDTLEIPAVKKAIFVVSEYKTEIDRGFIQVVNEYKGKIPVEIVFRENLGYSYSAWNDVLNAAVESKNLDEYYFLFEDDYVANQDYFYQDYLDRLKDNVGYVCQDKGDNHARLGNGIISTKIAKIVKDAQGDVFYIPHQDDTYSGAVLNNYHFLDTIKKSGFDIVGMQDKHITVFQHEFGFNVRGNLSGDVVVAPVSENNWKLAVRDTQHFIFRKYSESLDMQYLDLKIGKIQKQLSVKEDINKDIAWILLDNDAISIIGYSEVSVNEKDVLITSYLSKRFNGIEYDKEHSGFLRWVEKNNIGKKITIYKNGKCIRTYDNV